MNINTKIDKVYFMDCEAFSGYDKEEVNTMFDYCDTCVMLKLGLYFENDKSLVYLTNLIENDI